MDDYIVFSVAGSDGAKSWGLRSLTLYGAQKDADFLCGASPAASAQSRPGINSPVVYACQRDKPGLCIVGWEKEAPPLRCPMPEVLHALGCSPDGKLVCAGGVSGRLYVWSASTGDLLRSWPAHYKRVMAIAWSPCGSFFLTGGGDGILHAWDTAICVDVASVGASVAPAITWTQHTLEINAVTFGPGAGASSKAFSGSADRTVRAWSVATGALCATIAHPASVNAVVCDALESSLYAACADGCIYSTQLAPSPTATAGAPPPPQRVMRAHVGPVCSLALTDEGDALVSGGADGTIRVWNTASGVPTAAFDGHRQTGVAAVRSSAAAAQPVAAAGSMAVVALLLARRDLVERGLAGRGGRGASQKTGGSGAAGEAATAAMALSGGAAPAAVALKKHMQSLPSEWRGCATGSADADAMLRLHPRQSQWDAYGCGAHEEDADAPASALKECCSMLFVAAAAAQTSAAAARAPAVDTSGALQEAAALRARIAQLEDENSRWRTINNKLLQRVQAAPLPPAAT